MILNAKETTIAYRCPHCGTAITGMAGVFSLSGDMFKLKCTCGKSELHIENTKDKKYRLTVPCLICPKPHTYTMSDNLFFSPEVFRLGCTYTGLDLCFVGSKDNVAEAVKENENQLIGMLEEAGVENLDSLHEDNNFDSVDDPMIEDVIRFMLIELKDEGAIHCNCESSEESDYAFEFVAPDYNNIKVYCKKCGASVEIPMTSVANATEFLQIDELYLK